MNHNEFNIYYWYMDINHQIFLHSEEYNVIIITNYKKVFMI